MTIGWVTMRAVVVYESMYGNTHAVADHIATGLASTYEVTVVAVHEATSDLLDGVSLLIVGGPTHVHGMSSSRSRLAAAESASTPDSGLVLDPDAEGEGLRDWFDDLPTLDDVRAAAFDTRSGSVAPVVSGRASKGIARRLRHHGLDLVTDPESFLVDADNHLIEGEADRATAWARGVATAQ